jgi:hypothetical protein
LRAGAGTCGRGATADGTWWREEVLEGEVFGEGLGRMGAT